MLKEDKVWSKTLQAKFSEFKLEVLRKTSIPGLIVRDWNEIVRDWFVKPLLDVKFLSISSSTLER